MLSPPRSSARRQASRSSVMVHCCGWMVTPTLKRRSRAALKGAPRGLGSTETCCEIIPVTDTGPHAAVRVDPNAASPDFWTRYHEFRRIWRAETRPDDPVLPDAMEEERLKRDTP